MSPSFGADKAETFKAAEVDANDRTKEVTEPYDIKVGNLRIKSFVGNVLQGWTAFEFPGRGNEVQHSLSESIF